MSEKSNILIVIPALNEEAGIGRVIDDIPVEYLRGKGFNVNIVVVDGKSIDDTLKIAKQKNAQIYIQHGNGKGRGVIQTFKNYPNADYIVMLDGDDTYPANRIPEFIDSLTRGNDIVMGNRLKGEMEDGAMSRLNYIGNTVISATASVLYAAPMSDVCTGMWGFRREALNKLSLNSEGFELEAELFAEANKNRLKIAELSIDYRRRKGKTKLLPTKTGIDIVSKLVRRRFRGI